MDRELNLSDQDRHQHELRMREMLEARPWLEPMYELSEYLARLQNTMHPVIAHRLKTMTGREYVADLGRRISEARSTSAILRSSPSPVAASSDVQD